jgi:hypothetical protein
MSTGTAGYLPPIPPEAKAQHAARAIIKDARRGNAMATNIEQHITGLGRAQLATVISALFAELSRKSSDHANYVGTM